MIYDYEISTPTDSVTTSDSIPRRPGTFDSLRLRTYRLYFIGAVVSMTGSWLTVIAQSLLVYELTSSGVYLGIIGACQFLPVIFFSSWAGLVADRYDKRRVIIGLQSFALVQALGMAAVATMDKPPIVVLCIFAAFRGSTATFDLPVRRTMVVETVPAELKGNAIALNSAAMTSSLVGGAALGGALVATVGYSFTFMADAATYIVAIITLTKIRPSDLRSTATSARRKGQFRDGLRAIRALPEIRSALGITALTGTSYNFTVVLPILVDQEFGRPATVFTYLYSALSVGSVLGALFVARQAVVGMRLLSLCALSLGLSTIALGVNPFFILAFPLATWVGGSAYSLLSASVIVIQTKSEPSMQGRMVGFHSIASLGVWAVSAPFVGWLCEAAGPKVGITTTGFIALLGAAWGKSQIPKTASEQPALQPTS